MKRRKEVREHDVHGDVHEERRGEEPVKGFFPRLFSYFRSGDGLHGFPWGMALLVCAAVWAVVEFIWAVVRLFG